MLICAKEREDKSVVVTAFERYRVQTPVLQKDRDILRYVSEHLKSEAISQNLDPEKQEKFDNCEYRVLFKKFNLFSGAPYE